MERPSQDFQREDKGNIVMIDVEGVELRIGDEVAVCTSGQVRRGRVLKVGKLKNGNACAHIEYDWAIHILNEPPPPPPWTTTGVFSQYRSILFLRRS